MLRYKNIAIFTKTLWNEPPRIRHQLSRLLLFNKHKVTFFERCSVRQFKTVKYNKEDISFIRHFELLHHQLRPFNFLAYINNIFVKLLIKKNIKNDVIDLVINFNYDYDFLKDVFPNQKVITIINDDFVEQSKQWMRKSVARQLENTCKNSDIVFTIHYSQYRELKSFNKNTYMLFPWAGNNYIPPLNKCHKRDTVLFWGYIDQRVDWSLIDMLLSKNIKIIFIGHILSRVKHKINKYKNYNNFELLKPMPIEEIDFTDVCCSIIPYNIDIRGVKAISISNRTLQLLSYGIPIIHTALPDLIETPKNVVTKCHNNRDFLNAIEYFKNNFYLCQNNIELFLRDHYSDIRYKYIFDKVKEFSDVER